MSLINDSIGNQNQDRSKSSKINENVKFIAWHNIVLPKFQPRPSLPRYFDVLLRMADIEGRTEESAWVHKSPTLMVFFYFADRPTSYSR